MDDSQLTILCDYLEEIGIINEDNVTIFLETYSNLKDNLKITSISSIVFKFFKEYYTNSDTNLEMLTKTIECNFLKKIPLMKINFVKLLINKLETKIEIMRIMTYNNLMNNMKYIKKKYISNKSRLNSPKINKTYSRINSPRNNRNQSRDSTLRTEDFNANILTTTEIKEMKEMSECTFQPNHSKRNKKANLFNPYVYDKLYNDSKVLSNKKFYKTINYFKNESNDYTFTPNINKKKTKEERVDFINSIDKYNSKKKNLMSTLVMKEQKKLDNEYTFRPMINNSSFKSNTPFHIRLNEDYKIRENKLRAIRFDEQRRTNILKKSNSTSNMMESKINRFEKLYNDANLLKENKVINCEKIFKKNGYTFSPQINANVKVDSTFSERNDKFIQAKKEIQAEAEKKIKNDILDKKRTVTNEIQDKIVVDRLYSKDIDKIREKNNILNDLRKEHKIKFRKYNKVSKNSVMEFIENMNKEEQDKPKEMESIKVNSYTPSPNTRNSIRPSKSKENSPFEIKNESPAYGRRSKNSIKYLPTNESKEESSRQEKIEEKKGVFKSKALMNILKKTQ